MERANHPLVAAAVACLLVEVVEEPYLEEDRHLVACRRSLERTGPPGWGQIVAGLAVGTPFSMNVRWYDGGKGSKKFA